VTRNCDLLIIYAGFTVNWLHPATRREFLSGLAASKDLIQLYNITSHALIASGGSGALKLFGSPSAFIKATYPEHTWLDWKFFEPPPGTWEDKENVAGLTHHLATSLGVNDMHDWYRVTSNDIRAHGGSLLLRAVLRL